MDCVGRSFQACSQRIILLHLGQFGQEARVQSLRKVQCTKWYAWSRNGWRGHVTRRAQSRTLNVVARRSSLPMPVCSFIVSYVKNLFNAAVAESSRSAFWSTPSVSRVCWTEEFGGVAEEEAGAAPVGGAPSAARASRRSRDHCSHHWLCACSSVSSKSESGYVKLFSRRLSPAQRLENHTTAPARVPDTWYKGSTWRITGSSKHTVR